MGLMIVILLAAITLIIIAVGGFGIYYLYRQRENELLAIREYTSKSILWIDNVLTEVNRFQSIDLPKLKLEILDDVNLCINKYTHEANNNIDRLMDSDFYSKALKGMLPFGEGRKAFEDSFKNIEKQIISREELSQELEDIGIKYEKKLREDLLSGISKVEFNLSAKTKETLAKLKDNPSKALRILGTNGRFKNIAEEDVVKEATLSIGEFGILGFSIVSIMDPEAVGIFIGDILRDTIGADMVEQFGLEIKEWFIQEVGEGIGTEIIEILGTSVVPVLSILILALKVGKYIDLYDRIVVKKEPLQKMRKSAKESALRNLDKVGKSVYDTISSNLDKAVSALEKNLVESRDRKEKQHDSFVGEKNTIPG